VHDVQNREGRADIFRQLGGAQQRRFRVDGKVDGYQDGQFFLLFSQCRYPRCSIRDCADG